MCSIIYPRIMVMRFLCTTGKGPHQLYPRVVVMLSCLFNLGNINESQIAVWVSQLTSVSCSCSDQNPIGRRFFRENPSLFPNKLSISINFILMTKRCIFILQSCLFYIFSLFKKKKTEKHIPVFEDVEDFLRNKHYIIVGLVWKVPNITVQTHYKQPHVYHMKMQNH